MVFTGDAEVADALDLQEFKALAVRKKITGLRRILFCFGGQAADDRGPLELTFDWNISVTVDAAPNGQDLAIRRRTWIDPFTPPLSIENEEWVKEHGKWTAFSIDSRSPLSMCLGSTVRGVWVQSGAAATETLVIQLDVDESTIELQLISAGDELVAKLNGKTV